MTLPPVELKLVHLQLTAQCNLRCRFCGQWGDHGYRHALPRGGELDAAAWRRVIDQAAELAAAAGGVPEFVIWGGEPLLAECCREVLTDLRGRGFRTGLITNGLLLADAAGLINDTVDVLYVSLDGIGDIHDRIRNCPGLYDRIAAGMARLDRSRVGTVDLFTVCADNYRLLPDYPRLLPPEWFDRIIYQNLIFTTAADAAAARRLLRDEFGVEARRLEAWVGGEWDDYIRELPGLLRRVEAERAAGRYSMDVTMFPGELNPDCVLDWYLAPEGVPVRDGREASHCLTPFRHLHVGANGDVHGCVDFDDLIWGNVRRESLAAIFHAPAAERFRAAVAAGRYPLCKRCPWRFNTSLALDREPQPVSNP